MRRILALVGLLALAGAAFWLSRPPATPTPTLIAGLPDDGLRGAPCPARSLYEQDARKKQGVRPPAALGEKLRELFPLGSDVHALEARLRQEGFDAFVPCPNDESVSGARWLAKSWGQPDAYIYWRADGDKLVFLDGHVSKAE